MPGSVIGVGADNEAARILARRQHDGPGCQAILAGKVQVALIAGRTAEHGTCSILHQHEIRDPNREALARHQRMRDAQAGIEAALLGGLDHGLAGSHAAALRDERRSRRVARRDGRRHWMLRRQGHERHAEQRIRPCGEHLDLGRRPGLCQQGEADPGALAPPDPVGLHGPHPVRPAVQPIQRRQQIRSILRDAHEPLGELPLLDHGARPPAAAVDHLLVRQHGAVDRVPVDPALLPLHQSGPQHVQEQLLLLAVVLGVAGRKLSRPVDRKAHLPQSGAHRRDVGARPFGGMHAALPCCILGRQPECIPSHRVQHRVPARALVTRHDIAERIVAHVAHVDLAARIREHLQNVVFGLAIRGHVGHAEAPGLIPGLLPARLGGLEIVAGRRLWSHWCSRGRDVVHF